MPVLSRSDVARPAEARATYALCAILALAAVAISSLTQSSLLSEGGLGWDGAQYAQLASQCWREPMRALEPFVYRIGAPCLAALIPAPPKTALLLVNVTASIVLLFLMAAWLRRLVPGHIVPWLLAAFAFHWLAPLRYSWWYPTYVDPPAMSLMAAALLVSHRAGPLILLCAAGALFRETMAIVPAAFAAGRLLQLTSWGTRWPWRPILTDARVRVAIAALAASVAGIVFTHAVVTPGSDYWMLDSALHWAYTKPLPSYPLAWFVAYGPMLALPIVRWRPVARWFGDAPEYLALIAGVAVLAWIGGSDTERFLLWGAPIVFAAIGKAAAEIDWRRSIGPLVVLVAGQILNGRWFLLTPVASAPAPRAWPILTPLVAYRFEDLLSQSPDRIASALALIQYTVLIIALMVWFRRRQAS
jgi:hypothetical protein